MTWWAVQYERLLVATKGRLAYWSAGKRENGHLHGRKGEPMRFVAVTCQCGAKLKAPEKLAGRVTKCPKCGGVLKLPQLPGGGSTASSSRRRQADEPSAVPSKPPPEPAPPPQSGGEPADEVPQEAPANREGNDVLEPASPAKLPFWKKVPFLAGAGVAALLVIAFALHALVADRPQQGDDGIAVANAEPAGSAKTEGEGAKAKATEEPKQAPDKLGQLLDLLKKKGERLGEQNFATTLSEMYTKEEGRSATRLPLWQPGNFSLDPGAMARAIGQTRTEYFEDWPTRAAATDPVEIQIMLDDKLVPSLKYGGGFVGNVCIRAFTGIPDGDTDYVRAKFGAPTQEKDIGASKLLTYGRLRFVAERDKKISIVVF